VHRFRVEIEGDDLKRANAALTGSNIPTMGGIRGQWESEPPSDEMDTLAAIVDVDTAAEAVARVREHLPPGSDYTVRAAEQLDP
jgi:hypothetical protein